MDSIKYIIFGGLAVVSYLLLLAWQEDYPRVPAAPVSQAPQIESSVQTSSDVPSLPVSSSTGGATLDVPVVQPLVAAPVPEQTNTYVQVTTDVLNVTLDRNGGDIVSVSLPEFKKAIDVEDDPFVLLQRDALGAICC